MRYSPTQFVNLALCVAMCVTANAGDPKKLTQACPRLAPIDGAPAGTTLIDNDTVLRLAKEGRIAAVADSRASAADSERPSSSAESSIKNRWRTEHRRSVSAIQKLKQQLEKAESEHKALEAQLFALRKEIQRIRLRPRLHAKAQQIELLKKNLRHALDSFSRMIREARLAGAQPGWFRDLPRP
ncbi:MAG: hypothetical protein ABFS37_10335 [Acidobacteriota bacterium]